jgi:hypothetical protein
MSGKDSQAAHVAVLEDFASAYSPDSENGQALRAAIELMKQAGWQPIETAPRDGTEVLLMVRQRAGIPGCQLVGHYMPGGHCIEDHPPIASGWYFWNGCMFDVAAEPIAWHPLPAAPEASR